MTQPMIRGIVAIPYVAANTRLSFIKALPCEKRTFGEKSSPGSIRFLKHANPPGSGWLCLSCSIHLRSLRIRVGNEQFLLIWTVFPGRVRRRRNNWMDSGALLYMEIVYSSLQVPEFPYGVQIQNRICHCLHKSAMPAKCLAQSCLHYPKALNGNRIVFPGNLQTGFVRK